MRLIDADELINDIQHNLWDWQSVDGITATTVLKQTITDIKNEPTIDAVQVVRCKDCQYAGEPIYEVENDYWCSKHGIYIYENDYCSYGERRTDGAE